VKPHEPPVVGLGIRIILEPEQRARGNAKARRDLIGNRLGRVGDARSGIASKLDTDDQNLAIGHMHSLDLAHAVAAVRSEREKLGLIGDLIQRKPPRPSPAWFGLRWTVNPGSDVRLRFGHLVARDIIRGVGRLVAQRFDQHVAVTA
jgi:hypothetical protein